MTNADNIREKTFDAIAKKRQQEKDEKIARDKWNRENPPWLLEKQRIEQSADQLFLTWMSQIESAAEIGNREVLVEYRDNQLKWGFGTGIIAPHVWTFFTKEEKPVFEMVFTMLRKQGYTIACKTGYYDKQIHDNYGMAGDPRTCPELFSIHRPYISIYVRW